VPGRMVRDGLASSAAAVVGVSLLASTPQAPPPQRPAQGQQPAFAATTVVVEVDAIVTDSKGRFVPDLTADDFKVFEDGKPQRIQRIYVVAGSTTQAARTAGPAIAEAPARPQPAPQLPPAPPRVFILFFDQDHLTEGSFARLKPAGEEFLKAQFQPGDVGGVLVGGAMVGNRLTSSGEELIAAVRSAKISADQTSRRRDLQDWPRMSEVEAIRIAVNFDNYVIDQVVRRAERESPRGRIPIDVRPTVMEKARLVVNQLRAAAAHTLTTLQALVNGLARVPGRKTVVFMTEGFFVEESWAKLEQIVGLAARSNVRLYSIDALGLRRRDPGTDLGEMMPLETGGSIPLDAFNTVEEGPNMLANDTGGYVIRNTNDFAGALAEIARDTSHYYVIGYSPANAAMDGSFRSITVNVKPAGLSVRARRGYVATPQSPTPPAAGPMPAPGVRDVPVSTPERAAVTGAPPPSVPPAGATPPAVTAVAPPSTPSPVAAVPMRPDASGRVRDLASRVPEPSRGKALATQGWDRYSKGDLEGAEKLLSQAAAEPGAAPWVFYALGFAELGLGHADKAIHSWERVRAEVPEFNPVYLDLADACLQSNDPGRAIEVLREGERRWPQDTEILNALGTVQVQRGSLDDALGSFKRATEANPKESLAYFNLARTYELRYYRMRRFSQQEARWVANPADVRVAIENYQRYLKLGGPYEDQAKLALERLEWVK